MPIMIVCLRRKVRLWMLKPSLLNRQFNFQRTLWIGLSIGFQALNPSLTWAQIDGPAPSTHLEQGLPPSPQVSVPHPDPPVYPIGLGNIQAGTILGAPSVTPIESKILVFQSSHEVAQVISREIIQVSAGSPIQSLVGHCCMNQTSGRLVG
jgi:hypothetical protein